LFDSGKGDYVRRVNDYYSDAINKKETPDSDYGGSDIKDKIHSNKSCYDGDWPDGGDPNGEVKTKFDGKVETYAACENTYECINP